MKSKKGQSISINTIVVAAIALLVLVVIIFIFGGRMQIFTGGARNCESQGGTCAEDCKTLGETDGHVYVNIRETDCKESGDGSACCVKVIDTSTE